MDINLIIESAKAVASPGCKPVFAIHDYETYLIVTSDCTLHRGHGDGIIEIMFYDDQTAEIVDFEVISGHRQAGLGRALLCEGLRLIFERATQVKMMVPCRSLAQPWLKKFLEEHGFRFEVIEESFDCLLGTLHKASVASCPDLS